MINRYRFELRNSRLRAVAVRTVETLEQRAYLTGIGFGAAMNTTTASLGLSPASATLVPLVTGEGQADLVVANSTGSVSVALGNGDGSFNPAVDTIAVQGAPSPLAIGDFNGDGIPDIVAGTSGPSSGDISIILGNGDGTFKAANNIPALANNSAIAVAAFRDSGPDAGHEDVITVSNGSGNSNNAAIVFGNGAGGATSVNPFSLPFGSASAVATGDFNGDGHQDFLVVGQQANTIAVFLGNGDGTFKTHSSYNTGPSPTSVVVGNFRNRTINGLPELDIVTADSAGGEVSFLANNGDGTFAAPVNSPVTGSATGGGPIELRLANFSNGASTTQTDLVALLGPGSSADAVALVGNGDGTFRTGVTINTGGGTRNAIAAGNLNTQDNLTDVVLTSGTQVTSLLSAAVVDTVAPTAMVDATQAQGIPLATTYNFTVTYTDNVAVDASTLGNGNLVVTFPGNVTIAPALVSAGLVDGPTVQATYQLAFPSGLTTANNGVYQVTIDAGSVKDTSGNAVTPGSIGSFALTVAATTPPPTGDFAVSAVTGKLPLAAITGAKQKVGPSVTIIYNGTATLAKAHITATLYTSSTLIHDSSAAVAGAPVTKTVGKLKPGMTFKIHFKPFVYPAGAGSYYLVCDVGLNGAPDSFDGATATPITVAAAFVDAGALSVAPSKSTLVSGKKASALLSIENIGNVAYSGPATVDVSVVPAGGGTATLLATAIPVKLHINAGQIKKVKVTFTPAALPAPGPYNVELRINLPGDANSTNDIAMSLMTVMI